MPEVAEIWRHPIKAHGRESVGQITLSQGQTLPGDRVWAVAHENAQITGSEWAQCSNFTRGAKAPGLMAITAHTHENGETLTLSHPNLPDLTFAPDREGPALIDWSRPLVPENRAASSRIVRAAQGMTDTDFPSISLNNLASHRAVEGRLGRNLSIHRWRGNIWMSGLAPWEEFDWIGREIRVGQAVLSVRERITRCRATMANPATGVQDTNTLAVLNENWGHQDFGVYAVVTQSGDIAPGAKIEVL